ncbi:MAG TPA: hypothetical protein VFW34_12185 [Candidatus Rubrimentiphilum sp.]|nr:hypothetical protein [Candidatus Rubrimentiphilum sp.]
MRLTAAAFLFVLLLAPSTALAKWTIIPGKTTSAPSAVWSPDTNKVYVVLSGPTGVLFFTALNQDKTVASPYVSLGRVGPYPPALLWDPQLHKIDIVTLSADNQLWFAALNTDGTLYTSWRQIPGTLASTPALVWNPQVQKVDVLGRASDNSLWFAMLNADGSLFKNWISVPGGTPSSPAAAWDGSLLKIQVLVRASSNTLWFGTLNPDGSVFKPFTDISGNTISAPALIFDSGAKALYAFVRGGNNEVWFSRFDSQGLTIPVWSPISGRLLESPAVALNTTDGIAFIVGSMPYDYAAGTFTFIDDFPVSGPPRKPADAIDVRGTLADKAAVKSALASAWWRKFYAFNYADIRARQGGKNPPGFFLESVNRDYASTYFPRSGGALVKLWLITGDFKRAREVLQYTLDITKKAGVNRVPHYVFTSGQTEMTDQIDGQASIILAWALYAHQAKEAAFVSSTYKQVAALMDGSLGPVYFDPKFGLIRNHYFEHYREGRFWDTYDILTQSYVAQSLRDMIPIALSRGDTAHAKKWQSDKTILERAIAQRMIWSLYGRRVYAEMYEDGSTSLIFPGLSEFNFGPTAAGWEGVDTTVYDQTIAALMQYGSFVWNGHRVISVGFTKDMDIIAITSGKALAWQMLFYAQRGDWKQVEQTLAFVKDEQQRNNQPRLFESSQVKVSPSGVNIFNGAGNGEQVVWMLYALHEVAKLAGAKPL